MRNRAERRGNTIKKFNRRVKLSKAIRYFVGKNDDNDEELKAWLKRKADVPHSEKSDWWNAYETKKIKNKQTRLKLRRETKKELEEV